jgi:hypothetical protein
VPLVAVTVIQGDTATAAFEVGAGGSRLTHTADRPPWRPRVSSNRMPGRLSANSATSPSLPPWPMRSSMR